MKEKITKEIAGYLKSSGRSAEGKDLPSGQLLFDSGILDSFGMVELIVFLEKHYSIQLGEGDLVKENLDTIGHIADLVVSKLAK